jgi:hypothetical protein
MMSFNMAALLRQRARSGKGARDSTSYSDGMTPKAAQTHGFRRAMMGDVRHVRGHESDEVDT